MDDLKGFRTRLADFVQEASCELNDADMVELLVFMSAGAEANLDALAGMDIQIAEARGLYHTAATIALDKTLNPITDNKLEDNEDSDIDKTYNQLREVALKSIEPPLDTDKNV
jgi:hypothetical protein